MTAHPHSTRAAARPVVALVYRYVPQYRRPFYEALRRELDDRDIEFRLIYGEPGLADASKRDAVEIPWGVRVQNRVWRVGGREVYWQPCLDELRGAQLVIVEQASKLLLNYLLLARQFLDGPSVAFWGQGHNVFVHRASKAGENIKRRLSRHVDWWFAYNASSVRVVRELGYPPERITCVNNAVDTSGLREAVAAARANGLDEVRRSLGVTSSHVALFAGSLYSDKRLDFLLTAADLARTRLPDLELIVLGAGDRESMVRAATLDRAWLHVTGARFGGGKAEAFAVASVLLLPASVGLAILDGFAAELPLITTRAPFQGHELSYLEPGVNGIIVNEWRYPGEYADALVRVFTDEALLDRLKAGCRASSERYTLDAMAKRFADGVEAALAARC